MWVLLGVFSSVFLGIYDIFKKYSLKENAVIPVLFFASISSALLFVPFIVISHLNPEVLSGTLFYVPAVSWKTHLLILLKSVIVGSSWIFAYFALKNLPITIVAPVRASGPLWTLIGALTVFGEKLSFLQWTGLIITLLFYYLFSVAGRKEGINFLRNKWVLFIFLATIIGTVSSLYDKFLIARYDRMAVQAWFSIYMIVVLLPVQAFLWFPGRKKYTPFQWRWTIPLIGICLTIADFAYFYALTWNDSLIAILSVLRRGSVLISFTLGAFIFKEVNLRRKALILLGILAGIIIIIAGS